MAERMWMSECESEKESDRREKERDTPTYTKERKQGSETAIEAETGSDKKKRATWRSKVPRAEKEH